MNTVRIISGKYKNQAISTPGGATHPMGDREKLALFNMLSDILPGAKVVDAFAGSGALGLEALSRGASEVVFIEKSPKVCQIIRQNLKKLSEDGEVVVSSVKNYNTSSDFDVVLADPPYDNFDLDEVSLLANFLKIGGILVLSHPGETPDIPGLTLEKTRQYAAAHLSFYNKH